MRFSLPVISCLLLGCSIFSTKVWSQEQEVLPPDNSRRAIEEIVIQGSKLNQNLKKAPMSVTVFDREIIEKAGMVSLRDIDDYAPNVSINQIGQIGGSYISIRGIESNPFILNRTAVYVDGIVYRDPRTVRLHDAMQIEILRGPQGTLYGANADAGVIVITTKTPSQELNADLAVGTNYFANGQTYNLNGNVSGGLTDDLTGILNYEYEEGDSYVRNIGSSLGLKGEIKNLSLSAKLRYEPNDKTQLDLLLFYNTLDAPGLYEQEFPALDLDAYNAAYGASFNGGLLVDQFELANDAPKKTDEDESSFAMALRRDLSTLTLNITATYRNKDENSFGNDLDLTASPFTAGAGTVENSYWNLEARLSDDDQIGIDWIIGAAWYKDKKARVLATLIGPGGFDNFNQAPEQRLEVEDRALFGQIILPLSTDFNISAGLRYEQSASLLQQDEGSLDLGPIGEFVFVRVNEKSSLHEWVPKFSIDYALPNDIQLYASAAKGYLPGGYNLVVADKGSDIADKFGSYTNEELWSYEVGSKGNFFDDAVFLSAAAFYIDAPQWQEYNVLTADNGQILSTNLITSNAAIESKGFEIEMIANPTSELTIMAGFGYIDAHYSRYQFSPTEDFTGNKVKLIPEFDFNISAIYEFNQHWYLRGEAQATGKTALNQENTAFRETQWVLGMSAGYESEHYSIRAFAKNLTNERYASGLAYLHFLFGNDGNFYAPLANPRIIGLELSWAL